MNTVDEILETGRYTDRRGRSWRPNLGDNWVHFRGRKPRGELFYDVLTDPEMRLLIERDQHRDECPRVGVCRNHPVPRVTFCDVGGFDVWAAGELTKAEFARPCIATRAEAMDAARALAVGE